MSTTRHPAYTWAETPDPLTPARGLLNGCLLGLGLYAAGVALWLARRWAR